MHVFRLLDPMWKCDNETFVYMAINLLNAFGRQSISFFFFSLSLITIPGTF